MYRVRAFLVLCAAAGCHHGSSEQPDGASDASADASPLSVVGISLGDQHTCARFGDGRVKCWGDNYSGQLGYATTATCPVPARNGSMQPCSTTPQYVAGIAGTAGIALQSTRTYAWTADTAWRWGADEQQTAASATPAPFGGVTSIAQVAAGVAFTCARLTDGTVDCWGANNNGNLGDRSTTNRTAPAPVYGLTGVSELAAGQAHACALTGGTVACWGANNAGQLGTQTNTVCAGPDMWPCATEPTPVPGLSGVLHITAGEYHTCALLADHSVTCWGDNMMDELGVITAQTCDWGGGNPACSPSPTPVPGLAGVDEIAAGWYYTCARMQGGTVRCWGLDSNGQLGWAASTSCPADSHASCGETPTDVPGLANVIALGVGRSRHTCALLADASVSCWGLNNAGQVGDGTTNDATMPTAVIW